MMILTERPCPRLPDVDPLRIGVLGTARITTAALLEPAASVPEVTVAAVGARSQARALAYAERHGIPVAHGSYHELVEDPDIDAVYNPLPNSLHGPWTLKAIAAGKHVLCEKPFASNADEAARVTDAAEGSGLVVMEAMHYRYHPLIRRLAELVGELGPVRHIQGWTSFAVADPGDIRYDYALGGGALMDGGCYVIDCLRLIARGASDREVRFRFGQRTKRMLVLHLRLAGQYFEANAFQARHRTGEISAYQFLVQPDCFEDLRALIALQGRNPHLGKSLQQSFIYRFDELPHDNFRSHPIG